MLCCPRAEFSGYEPSALKANLGMCASEYVISRLALMGLVSLFSAAVQKPKRSARGFGLRGLGRRV